MRSLRNTLRAVLALTLAIVVSGLVGLGTAAAQTQPTLARRVGAKPSVAVRMAAPAADGSVTYTILAINNRERAIKYFDINLPLNLAAGRVLSVQSNDSRVWVPSRSDNALLVRIETLGGNGDSATVTLRASGAVLKDRLTFTWADESSGNSGVSNFPSVMPADDAISRLAVAPLSGQAGSYTFSSSEPIFAPGEPVTFWYNGPNGSIVALRVRDGRALFVKQPKTSSFDTDEGGDFAVADAQGALQVIFNTSRLPRGDYSLVARGNWTGFTAMGTFQVR